MKSARRNQEGMVLLSALLILAAVSLIAVGLSRDSFTGYRVAGNLRVHQQTFNMADGGANLGVLVARDFVMNVDEDLVSPEDDYPHGGLYNLDGEGGLYMRRFLFSAPDLMQDINGYDGNNNILDNTDPTSAVPHDLQFDVLRSNAPLAKAETRVTVDIDLVDKYAWGSSEEHRGYHSPVSTKWVYSYAVRSRATDWGSQNPTGAPTSDANRRLHTEVGTVYDILK